MVKPMGKPLNKNRISVKKKNTAPFLFMNKHSAQVQPRILLCEL